MAGTSRISLHGKLIVFEVNGDHTDEGAEECTQRLVEFALGAEEPIEFVADISRVTGHSSRARAFWQDAFKKAKPKIKRITLVGGTPLARMAATAVGLFAGIPVRSCASLDEVLSFESVDKSA